MCSLVLTFLRNRKIHYWSDAIHKKADTRTSRLQASGEWPEEYGKEEKIRKKANEILDTYQEQLDPRVYQLAKEEVKKTEKKVEKIEETPKLEAAKQPVLTKKKIVKRRKIEGTKE